MGPGSNIQIRNHFERTPGFLQLLELKIQTIRIKHQTGPPVQDQNLVFENPNSESCTIFKDQRFPVQVEMVQCLSDARRAAKLVLLDLPIGEVYQDSLEQAIATIIMLIAINSG